MFTLAVVDVHLDEQFRRWYDVFHAGEIANRSAPFVRSVRELAAYLREPSPRRRSMAIWAMSGGEVVGAMVLEFPTLENRGLATLAVAVPPAFRGRGAGTALVEYARDAAVATGRTSLLGEVHVPVRDDMANHPGARFAVRHGFSSKAVDDHLLLELPAPADTLARFADAGTGSYTVVGWVGDCPAQSVRSFAAMRTALEREVPIGELDVEPKAWDSDLVRVNDELLRAQGVTQLTVVAVAGDGAFVGYSQLLVPLDRPPDVLQNDTFVGGAHRGHRLGAAMKAVNLRALAREFPDRQRVHAWTSIDNAPMQHINRAFGFVAVEQTHEFQRSL